MRRSIAFAAAMALAALSAQAHAQSRYGPGPSTLSWHGKTPPPAQAESPAQPVAPERPEPIAPWAQRMAAQTPPPAPAFQSPAPVAVARLEPALAPTAAPPARALPTHLYDSPPPPAPAVQPAPQQQTALLGAPAPRPAAAPLNPSAVAGPRFYSVYREYGVAPDAIPTAPQANRGQETTLREIPTTPSLSGPDDTEYLPARRNAEAASRTH